MCDHSADGGDFVYTDQKSNYADGYSCCERNRDYFFCAGCADGDRRKLDKRVVQLCLQPVERQRWSFIWPFDRLKYTGSDKHD